MRLYFNILTLTFLMSHMWANPMFVQECELDSTCKILFIGNSLTYVNDLPGLVSQYAMKKGIKVHTRMIAQPNYALIDHLNDGKIQREIKKNHYDFVIVQQGPSSQEEGRQMLFDAGYQLSALCHEHHAQLAYFMVWPSRSFQQSFDGVIQNYRDAAQDNQAILCPVGEQWKKHIALTGLWDYYGPDDFHPSLLGSQVAAEVIVDALFKTE